MISIHDLVKRFKIALLLALAMYLLIMFLSCNRVKTDQAISQNQPLKVVATTGMLGDALENIGGSLLQVEILMGPGVDPHLYKASERNVSDLAEADVIVFSGLHLEGKMTDILEKMARTKQVICASDAMPRDSLMSPPQFGGNYDPHIWFDLRLWAIIVEGLGQRFAQIDTIHARTYIDNAAAYAVRIRALDDSVRAEIASIPVSQRVLISAHDAFGYFGRAYDIEVRGLQGVSTASEFGLKDVTNLVDFIKERGIKAIFVESSVPRRSIEAVQQGVQAGGGTIAIGGTLYSDALGESTSSEGNYLGMVRANLKTIVNALR